MKIENVVSGSSAFIVVTQGHPILGVYISAFMAPLSLIDIIWAPDKKSEQHGILKQRFTDLLAEVERSAQSEEHLKEFRAQRLKIENDEPPCKRIIDLRARNDELRQEDFLLKVLFRYQDCKDGSGIMLSSI